MQMKLDFLASYDYTIHLYQIERSSTLIATSKIPSNLTGDNLPSSHFVASPNGATSLFLAAIRFPVPCSSGQIAAVLGSTGFGWTIWGWILLLAIAKSLWSS